MFPQLFDSEGFFVARLRKTASVAPLPQPGYRLGKLPFTPVNKKMAAEVANAAASVGLQWSDELTLWQRDKEIWLFPEAITPLLGSVRFSRIGLKLAETFARGYRWQHEAVIALAQLDAQRTFELSADEALEWYRGRDIFPETPPQRDEMIVTYQQQPLGLAKRVGSRIKNSYPRELVRDGRLFR